MGERFDHDWGDAPHPSLHACVQCRRLIGGGTECSVPLRAALDAAQAENARLQEVWDKDVVIMYSLVDDIDLLREQLATATSRPRASMDEHLDRVVAGAKAEERAAIVAWLRTYDEASPHDDVARQLATRIERGSMRRCAADGNNHAPGCVVRIARDVLTPEAKER